MMDLMEIIESNYLEIDKVKKDSDRWRLSHKPGINAPSCGGAISPKIELVGSS